MFYQICRKFAVKFPATKLKLEKSQQCIFKRVFFCGISSNETRIFHLCVHNILPLDPIQTLIKWVLTHIFMSPRHCCNTAILTTPVSSNNFLPSSSSGHIFVFIFSFCRTCCKAYQSNSPCFLHHISVW
jgi:hypothetical protein